MKGHPNVVKFPTRRVTDFPPEMAEVLALVKEGAVDERTGKPISDASARALVMRIVEGLEKRGRFLPSRRR